MNWLIFLVGNVVGGVVALVIANEGWKAELEERKAQHRRELLRELRARGTDE